MVSITSLGWFHMPRRNSAHVSQLLKPACPRAQREATTMWNLCTATREEPLLTVTRESPCAAMKTQHSQKKKKNSWTLLKKVMSTQKPVHKCTEQHYLQQEKSVFPLRGHSNVHPLRTHQGSSQPRDRIQVSHSAGRFFTIWTTSKSPKSTYDTLHKN